MNHSQLGLPTYSLDGWRGVGCNQGARIANLVWELIIGIETVRDRMKSKLNMQLKELFGGKNFHKQFIFLFSSQIIKKSLFFCEILKRAGNLIPHSLLFSHPGCDPYCTKDFCKVIPYMSGKKT